MFVWRNPCLPSRRRRLQQNGLVSDCRIYRRPTPLMLTSFRNHVLSLFSALSIFSLFLIPLATRFHSLSFAYCVDLKRLDVSYHTYSRKFRKLDFCVSTFDVYVSTFGALPQHFCSMASRHLPKSFKRALREFGGGLCCEVSTFNRDIDFLCFDISISSTSPIDHETTCRL